MELILLVANLLEKILNIKSSLAIILSYVGFVATLFTIFLLFGIWLERKLIARIQSRYGPTYIGPFGLLVNIADFIKLLSKEDLIPIGASKFLFKYTPLILASIPFIILLLLPYSPNGYIINQSYSLILPLAFIVIVPSIILLSGYSQNNKYSYIGALRSAAQQLAYEIPLVLSLLSVAIFTKTFNLLEIVEMQKNGWLIFYLPLSFIIFFISAIASTERIPFDIPFAENELVAGWKTEYSGIRYALTLEFEYGMVLIVSLLSSLIFFGGWLNLEFLPKEISLIAKSLLIVLIFFILRAAFPRYRIDQLLKISWKILIPLSVINLAIIAFLF